MDRVEVERVKVQAAAAAYTAEREGRWPPACPYDVESPEGRVFLAQIDSYADRLMSADPEVPDIEDGEVLPGGSEEVPHTVDAED